MAYLMTNLNRLTWKIEDKNIINFISSSQLFLQLDSQKFIFGPYFSWKTGLVEKSSKGIPRLIESWRIFCENQEKF